MKAAVLLFVLVLLSTVVLAENYGGFDCMDLVCTCTNAQGCPPYQKDATIPKEGICANVEASFAPWCTTSAGTAQATSSATSRVVPVTPISQPSGNYPCTSAQRCQEIDVVWTGLTGQAWAGIGMYVNPSYFNQIWNPNLAKWDYFVDSITRVSSTGSTSGKFSDYDFGDIKFSNTAHLPALIEEAKRQGMNPCFPLVTVLFESKGDPDAIGNDANVIGCEVIARRLLLMSQSSNCRSQYTNQQALRTDCMKDSTIGPNGFHIPSQKNGCLIDFLNLQEYNLLKSTKNDFCGNNFAKDSLWGIGLGQITLPENQDSIVVDNAHYNHCDLFDPAKNINATVGRLKEKGALTANNEASIKIVFNDYVGGGEQEQKRYEYFQRCMDKQQPLVA